MDVDNLSALPSHVIDRTLTHVLMHIVNGQRRRPIID